MCSSSRAARHVCGEGGCAHAGMCRALNHLGSKLRVWPYGVLQAEVEVRMWTAADESDRRRAAASADPPIAKASTASPSAAGPSTAPAAAAASSLPNGHAAGPQAAGGHSAGAGVKAEGGGGGDAVAGLKAEGDGAAARDAAAELERPLAIMHGVLHEAAGRLALNEVRVGWGWAFVLGRAPHADGRVLELGISSILSASLPLRPWPSGTSLQVSACLV